MALSRTSFGRRSSVGQAPCQEPDRGGMPRLRPFRRAGKGASWGSPVDSTIGYDLFACSGDVTSPRRGRRLLPRRGRGSVRSASAAPSPRTAQTWVTRGTRPGSLASGQSGVWERRWSSQLPRSSFSRTRSPGTRAPSRAGISARLPTSVLRGCSSRVATPGLRVNMRWARIRAVTSYFCSWWVRPAPAPSPSVSWPAPSGTSRSGPAPGTSR